jgi:hypothetical protein
LNKLYSINESLNINLRQLEEKDIPQCYDLFKKSLPNYKISVYFNSEEEFSIRGNFRTLVEISNYVNYSIFKLVKTYDKNSYKPIQKIFDYDFYNVYDSLVKNIPIWESKPLEKKFENVNEFYKFFLKYPF